MIRTAIVLGLSLVAAPAFAGTVVAVPQFDGVGLEGGGHVVLKYGAQQRVTLVKGSTQFTDIRVEHGSLKIDACNEHCPNHYDLEIEVITPSLKALAVRGGGEIESAAGFPAQNVISVAVSGGGDIKVKNVKADTINAAVHGGGSIDVYAQRTLNAAVAGGGEITYFGNPAKVSQAAVGGGEITRGS
ncbi:MAG TPA: DUF2807 domain-containing protein [Rhizomicrobium sp.]|jgi:hypothetical protein|nr:DUF2807 domain-containing protein [Rhizomicrobium sp.]